MNPECLRRESTQIMITRKKLVLSGRVLRKFSPQSSSGLNKDNMHIKKQSLAITHSCTPFSLVTSSQLKFLFRFIPARMLDAQA